MGVVPIERATTSYSRPSVRRRGVRRDVVGRRMPGTWDKDFVDTIMSYCKIQRCRNLLFVLPQAIVQLREQLGDRSNVPSSNLEK